MYQPHLWASYNVGVRIGNQLCGTYRGSVCNQPHGSFVGFSGPFSDVVITNFTKGIGVAYGTLDCTI